MKYDLKLTVNNGFIWHEYQGIHYKGYFYIEGQYKSPDTVCSYFNKIKNKDEFLKCIKKIGGCFCIVMEIDGRLIAASDLSGSFPLFYAVKNNVLFIRDDSEAIVRDTGFNKINHTALIDYLHFECVMYNDTLVDGVNMLPAMKYLYIEEDIHNLECGKYLTLYSSDYSINESKIAKRAVDSAFASAAKRLCDSLQGRTAVVSLSGGVDSRACLLMLKRQSYENVICYTYGRKNNSDTEVANAVAEYMGYTHIFIPYERKNWRKAYKDKYTKKFIKASHNLSAITHMESHFVVRRLINEKLVPADSIFITGHVGVMSKSHFEEDRNYSKEELVEKIWTYYGKLYSLKGNRKKHYTQRLGGYIGHEESYPRQKAESIYENAGYEMCRGRHLINSHRQFEINGCEWRIPMMDYEIMSTFESIDPCVRDEKKKFFTDFIVSRTGENIKEAKFKKSTISKAYKNLSNPVYSIMRPWKFLTLGYKNCLLPPFPVRQYRFIRRFYSYCALVEIQLIKKWLNLS